MWSSEVSAKLVQIHSKSALSGKGYEKESWNQSQDEVFAFLGHSTALWLS